MEEHYIDVGGVRLPAQPCKECDGTGRTTRSRMYRARAFPSEGRRFRLRYTLEGETCPFCVGRGLIPKPG